MEDRAKEILDRDVKLGVIKKLPANQATEWCARLVWTVKENGDLRRTIDLTGLNKASKRQIHMTTTPYEQASKIPENTLKTTMEIPGLLLEVPFGMLSECPIGLLATLQAQSNKEL